MFYKDGSPRCKIADEHLKILAKKHVEARFCKLNVERCPFLTGVDKKIVQSAKDSTKVRKFFESLKINIILKYTELIIHYYFMTISERLRIKIIPTIALISDSKTKDYIVGFTDLGNCDDFSTEMLEWRIAQSGAIAYNGDLMNPPEKGKKTKSLLAGKPKTIRSRESDGSDDDWD